MKRIYMLLLLLLTTFSFSQKVDKNNQCPKIYKNNYTKILHEKYVTVNEKDTVTFNELRYECVYAYSYTQCGMFDKFGKWSQMLFPANNKYPILMWEKVNLFNDGKKYDVFAYGVEEWKHIYASVMVLDENGVDLLAENSPKLEKLKSYFGNLIKQSNIEKSNFSLAFKEYILPEIEKRK